MSRTTYMLLIFQHERLVGHEERTLADIKVSAVNGIGVMKEVKAWVLLSTYRCTCSLCVLDD